MDNMRILKLSLVALLLTTTVTAQKSNNDKQTEQQLKEIEKNHERLMKLYGNDYDANNPVDKMSYAYGLSVAESFSSQGIEEVNLGAFMKGMSDVLADKETAMTMEEAQQFMNEYMQQLKQIQIQKAKERGQAFLAENAKRKGVQVTPSGLQYEVIKEGTGEHPSETSKVTVHYEGTTIDGKIFDSSKQRGQPATFGLNQVIKGWTEGLQLMTPGAIHKLYIPSELAYGDRGAGQAIGPGETLIFEVELISIN